MAPGVGARAAQFRVAAPVTNLAIGKETPWGVAAALLQHLPGTTAARVMREDLKPPATAPDVCGLNEVRGRPLVVVVRDAARHPWMSRALAELVEARPDAIVVEMGLPGKLPGAVNICTHGASTVSGAAVAELLAGARQAS